MNTTLRFCILMSGASLLASCQKEKEPAEQPRPVISIIAQRLPVAPTAFAGTVGARVETEFGFRILGRVVARNVQVGDLVNKGDVLATIDPLALEFSVKSAQSDLANSLAQLTNARTIEKRQKTLFEKQSGAKAAYETAELERRTAEAAVAKAHANLDKAEEQLGYSRLLAEFDGVVTATSAEVGQVVSAGQSVAKVARPEEREAVIDVPEAGSLLLVQGTAFDVSLQLDPKIHATGIVREIAPEADDATRTRRARLTLVDPPQALRLGSVITASAAADSQPTIRLPASAIRMVDGKPSVWVINAQTGKVSSRVVILDGDPMSETTITVTEGVAPGDRVVTAGVNKLEDDQTVRVGQEINK
ncbi:efflux RND transporter periplasmic adaptor subunit [Agrobacterium sp. rho-13.3]|uniref:efflux RND transporter periplasmic adaptor subunit n=1 Tax=Agrobacterium sp. rho-13.3 TaxID=3072980 RepID=UPI002A0B4EA8|nr:efflux RND transporter periplasmic adaptor subunit [Agrobacterium sp. rho-13.3]MDX8306805.1 efflux RND transporter periplasmic adaptor subunit [Agrobacterium sp. rho-13.3]MDX8306864.1 efflux RND transporter periplasmic adaptor subunit [Agrobacterium sp. rho-13.3]